jgi:hypothetical protein
MLFDGDMQLHDGFLPAAIEVCAPIDRCRVGGVVIDCGIDNQA